MERRNIILVIILIGFLLFDACARNLTGSKTADDLVIFPMPPDTTRIQFLTTINSSLDVEGKQSGFNKFLFGPVAPKVISKPYGITTHKSKIYICDTGLGGLIVIDLAKKSFVPFTPSGLGQLKFPINCALDDRDFLYVADGNRRQVVIFDQHGKYIDAIGGAENFKPTGVAIAGDKIYVASVMGHSINIYNRDNLKLVSSFPDSEAGDQDYLYQPTNISVSKDEIFVSDMGDYKIKIYSTDGKFIRSVGGYGNGFGQLMRPKGIAVDDNDKLYIVDAAFENVQIFDKLGRLLMFFGGPYSRRGYMWLPAGITIDDEDMEYFRNFVDRSFDLQYLIFVANQYGPDKIGVYGFVKKKGSTDS